MSKPKKASVAVLPSGTKKGKQPPFEVPLLVSLTPSEISSVVESPCFTTSDRSLVDPEFLVKDRDMDAVNARNGCGCHWRHEEWWSGGEEEAVSVPEVWTRFSVELKIGDVFLVFEWKFEAGDGAAEYELNYEQSQRAFMVLATMIGVPVRRGIVVGRAR